MTWSRQEAQHQLPTAIAALWVELHAATAVWQPAAKSQPPVMHYLYQLAILALRRRHHVGMTEHRLPAAHGPVLDPTLLKDARDVALSDHLGRHLVKRDSEPMAHQQLEAAASRQETQSGNAQLCKVELRLAATRACCICELAFQASTTSLASLALLDAVVQMRCSPANAKHLGARWQAAKQASYVNVIRHVVAS